jgi:hypothetical protein
MRDGLVDRLIDGDRRRRRGLGSHGQRDGRAHGASGRNRSIHDIHTYPQRHPRAIGGGEARSIVVSRL